MNRKLYLALSLVSLVASTLMYFYIFDATLASVYHGQLDDSRPGNGKPVTGNDIRKALDTLLANKTPLENQKPSVGCGIKWK